MRRPIKKLIILKCSHCNKEFYKYPSQIKANKDTVFCGNKCVIDYRKIHWNGKTDRKCIECNKEFKIFKSELRKCKSAGKYCSKKCQSSRSFILNCTICRKEFKAHKSDMKRGKRFCSSECHHNRTNPKEYFLKNISYQGNPNNCWIWLARKDKDGYGIMWAKKSIRAHRYSWILYNNENIPKNMIICHKCDTPSCVNPKHIYLGTHTNNADDRKNKGRYQYEL